MTRRSYGNENTSLILSDKAFEAYNNSDPLSIYEYDTEDGTFYDMEGIIEVEGVSAEDVNWLLEELAEPDEEPKITEEEVRELARLHGNEYAANLLLLGGPDWLDGSYEQYEQLYKELKGE